MARIGRTGVAALAAAATLLLASCADTPQGGASGDAPATTEASSGSSSAGFEAISSLPEELQEAYEGLDQPVGESTLKDWSAPEGPPWTIGYASSYAGNSWRAEGMNRLMEVMLPQYREAGLVDEIIVTQSDLNDAMQIQQIRQLADQGVDAIIVCCSSITALNEAIAYAWDKGVPILSWSGYVTSPYAINVSANYIQGGREAAQWMVDQLGEEGTILNVVGIPGAASSDTYDAGVKAVLSQYPGIEVVGDLAGSWTNQVAQTEVLQFLGTYSGEIDGVLTQSAQETGVLQAFLQSGREVPPMNIGGQIGAACYWRQNPDWVDQGFHIWPPGDEMQFAFEAAIRTLQGQGPKIESMIREPLVLTWEEVENTLTEDCSTDDQGWIQPGPEVWMPSSMLDGFFEDPADPLAFEANQ